MMTREELLDDLWRALPAGSRSPKLLGRFADAMIAAGLDWTPAHSDTLASVLAFGALAHKGEARTPLGVPKCAPAAPSKSDGAA